VPVLTVEVVVIELNTFALLHHTNKEEIV
jgi:hypothetical protein